MLISFISQNLSYICYNLIHLLYLSSYIYLTLTLISYSHTSTIFSLSNSHPFPVTPSVPPPSPPHSPPPATPPPPGLLAIYSIQSLVQKQSQGSTAARPPGGSGQGDGESGRHYSTGKSKSLQLSVKSSCHLARTSEYGPFCCCWAAVEQEQGGGDVDDEANCGRGSSTVH